MAKATCIDNLFGHEADSLSIKSCSRREVRTSRDISVKSLLNKAPDATDSNAQRALCTETLQQPTRLGTCPPSDRNTQLHSADSYIGPRRSQPEPDHCTATTIPIEIDFIHGSRVRQQRRKRNAQASRQFRARRKTKEQEMSQHISSLQGEVRRLQDEVRHWRQCVERSNQERHYFRGIVTCSLESTSPNRASFLAAVLGHSVLLPQSSMVSRNGHP